MDQAMAALDTRAKQKKFAKNFLVANCLMCDRELHSENALLRHQTAHKKYYKVCPFCKLRLPTKFEFTAHSSQKGKACPRLALKRPLPSCDHDGSDQAAAKATVDHDG